MIKRLSLYFIIFVICNGSVNPAGTIQTSSLTDSTLIIEEKDNSRDNFYMNTAKQKANELKSDNPEIKAAYQKLLFLGYKFPVKRASEFSDTLIALANNINDLETIAKTYDFLSVCFISEGKTDSAILNLNSSEKIYRELQDSLGIAGTLSLRSSCYVSNFEMIKGLEMLYQAEAITNRNGNKVELSRIYNNIGTLNIQLGYFEDAKKYLEKSYENLITEKDSLLILNTLTNLALTYTKIDSLKPLAEKKYSEALKLAQYYHYDEYITTLFINLGQIAEADNNYNKALEYYNKAVSSAENVDDKNRQLLTYMNIGKIMYSHFNDYAGSEKNLNKALRFVGAGKNAKLKSSIYWHFYKLYKLSGKHAEALEYYEKHQGIVDSLNEKTKNDEYLEISKKYESEKKDKEILQLEVLNSNQKYLIATLVVIALLMLLIVLMLVFRRKQIKLKNETMELKNKNLLTELENNNKELAQKALYIAHIEEDRKKFVSEINGLIDSPPDNLNQNLKEFSKKALLNSNNSKYWLEFDQKFSEINPLFSKKLVELYPDLTPVELRVVSLLKLKLSTKEIAEIFHRSTRTIENTRKSIRKKMNLEQTQNLTTHILGL